MSRTIRTISGEEISGLNSDFRDEGDVIVKKGWGYETRIPKGNIAFDTSVSTALEVGVAVAALGVAAAILLSSDR